MSKSLVSTVIALGVSVEGAGIASAATPSEYVVRGHESVTLEDGAMVHGGVGVHATGGVPYRVKLGAGAVVDATAVVAAESVLLAPTSTTGAIDASLLTDQGASHGVVGPMMSVDPVAPPSPFGHGTTDISVAEGATRTLAPGEYGVLHLHPHSTLLLSGGLYRLTSLSAGEGVRIAIVEDAVIDVVGRVLIGPHATIGAADGAPGDTDVVVQTLSPDVDGAAIRIGPGANLVGTFRAASAHQRR